MSETEPTYEYVKGKGWIARIAQPYNEAFCAEIRILDRVPEPHEKYICQAATQSFEGIVATFYNWKYADFSPWGSSRGGRTAINNSRYHYYTVLPL